MARRRRGRGLAQELCVASSSGLAAGSRCDDVLVGDRVVQRGHDPGERRSLAQALVRLDALPRAEVRVEQCRPRRLVLLPLQRVEVDERMGDARVRPVEVRELCRSSGRRSPDGGRRGRACPAGQPPGGDRPPSASARAASAPRPPRASSCSIASGSSRERIHLGLEDVEPAIETAGGEQLHGDPRRRALEPGIAAKQLRAHLERRLPADQVVELRRAGTSPARGSTASGAGT